MSSSLIRTRLTPPCSKTWLAPVDLRQIFSCMFDKFPSCQNDTPRPFSVAIIRRANYEYHFHCHLPQRCVHATECHKRICFNRSRSRTFGGTSAKHAQCGGGHARILRNWTAQRLVALVGPSVGCIFLFASLKLHRYSNIFLGALRDGSKSVRSCRMRSNLCMN